MTETRSIERGRVDLAISELEKLKSRVASIESRYSILNENYTRICEEALASINEYNTISTTPEQTIIQRDCPKIPENSVCHELVVDRNHTMPLEEILVYQRKQDHKPARFHTQSIVDIIGNGIEKGLDKLGDGLVYPFEKIANLLKRKSP